ncbi:hypothetical protein RB595_001865 [Gaeumannomyces hyphopodioides]
MSRDKTTPKPRVLRKLGNLEKYQVGMHHGRYYTGTSVLCRYVIPRSVLETAAPEAGYENPEAAAVARVLELAVASVVLEQPLLRVGLLGEAASDPSWVELDSINLADHIEWRFPDTTADKAETGRQRHKLAREQLDTEFTDFETRPGWKVIASWLGRQRIDVLFVWNHAHMDGMSGKMFHGSLLRHLNSGPAAGAAPALKGGHVLAVSTPKDRFPPAQDDVVVFPVSAVFAAKEGWKEYRPVSLTPRDERATLAFWVPHVQEGGGRPESRLRVIETPAAELGPLLRRCRDRGTTLTGLLHALALASLSLQLAGGDKEELSRAFTAATAMNTRRFADDKVEQADGGAGNRKWRKKYPWFEPTGAMGNYVSCLSHKFFPQTVADMRREWAAVAAADAPLGTLPGPLRELVWTAAVMARGDIDRRIEAGPKDDLMGVMRVVGNWNDFLKAKYKRAREASWLVTNIGVIDGGEAAAEGERWTVDDAEFHLGADVLSAALEISAVSVKGKGLKTTICWQDGATEQAIGEGFAANLEAWLRELAGDGNPTIPNGQAQATNGN